jgi:hypothetical protein
MKHIEVEPDLYHELKVEATLRGLSVSNYVNDLLQEVPTGNEKQMMRSC